MGHQWSELFFVSEKQITSYKIIEAIIFQQTNSTPQPKRRWQ
jgi:hypothetical protein